ncbi:hypothetical protein CYMTET_2860 [Cymbomonas tetramitiformis]|uniref:NrS-1 polymerase-like helicase domain-containing protein n=1 Tax=Cymbomonas tetramitiformis TaxID=36881 RepID=A0AAE0H678_9CHLO|nr:hypothetical protein CYMTET_2860 [Cymbomonas tetramitiformis]
MERTAGQEAIPVYYGADGFAAGKYKDGAAGNYAENNHHKLRLSTDVGFVGGAKAYTSIIDCATFADKLLPQLRELELNHVYEQLTGPVRFYADIEWYAQSDPTHVVEGTKIAFLKAFMDCAEESIRSKCKVSADAAVFRDAWRLSEASNEKKASFHVTLIDVGYFSSNQLIKQLQIIQDITERLTAKNAAFAELFKNSKEKGVPLDISPYGNDNSFRLLHCAKKADPQRTLRPVRITLDDKLEVIPDGQYNYLDYVVSHIPDGEHALVPKNLSDLKVNLNSRRNRSKVSGTPRPSQRTIDPVIVDTRVRRVVSELVPGVFEAIDSDHIMHQYKDIMNESTATLLGNGDMVVVTARTGTCPWKSHKIRTDAARILFRKDEIRLSCHDPDCREEAGRKSKLEYIPVKYPTSELAEMAREILAGEVSVAAIAKTIADKTPRPPRTTFSSDDEIMADGEPRESGVTDEEEDDVFSGRSLAVAPRAPQFQPVSFASRPPPARAQKRNPFVDDEASGEDGEESTDEEKDGDDCEFDENGKDLGQDVPQEAISIIKRLLRCKRGASRDMWLREHEKVVHSVAKIDAYNKKLFQLSKKLFPGTDYMDGRDSGPYKLTTLETERGSLKRKREDAPPDLISKLIRFTTDGKVCNASKTLIEYDVHNDGTFTAKCKDPTCWACPIDLKGFNPPMVNLIKVHITENNINHNTYISDSNVNDADLLPNEVLLQYNKLYAKVLYGGKMCVAMLEDPPNQHMRFMNFHTFTEHQLEKGHHHQLGTNPRTGEPIEKFVQHGRAWLGHSKANKFNNAKFIPGDFDCEQKGILNLWRGWGVEPSADGDCSYFWDLTKDLCGDCDSLFEYVKHWMAHMFQFPNQKPGTVLLFGGKEEGVGLDSLISCLTTCIGAAHVFVGTRTQDLVSHFNGAICDSLLVFLNEAGFAGNHEATAALKAMVTDRRQSKTNKGKDSVMVDTCYRVIKGTNQPQVAAVTGRARREMCFDPTGKYFGDKEFWKAFQNQMFASENLGCRRLLYELLEMNIVHFDPRTAPTSVILDKAVWVQRRLSLPPVQQFVHRFLDVPVNDFNAANPITCEDLYDWFKSECGHLPSAKYITTKIKAFQQRVHCAYDGMWELPFDEHGVQIDEAYNVNTVLGP